MENHIISVERIKQFMHISPEPPAVINGSRPPPSWPHEGRIDLENLKIRYRPTAPYVLKGITCSFPAGNKIGVVGRTGSGKTTLISALFRLIDPAHGRILIDNIDIGSIGLKDLRLKLSIIPQEPTLFRGSLRSNLDPLGMYADHEISEALERCQLKSTIRSLPAKLNSASGSGELVGRCGGFPQRRGGFPQRHGGFPQRHGGFPQLFGSSDIGKIRGSGDGDIRPRTETKKWIYTIHMLFQLAMIDKYKHLLRNLLKDLCWHV